jgi:hypothetical protein
VALAGTDELVAARVEVRYGNDPLRVVDQLEEMRGDMPGRFARIRPQQLPI